MRTRRVKVFRTASWAIGVVVIAPTIPARAQIVQVNQLALVQANQPLVQETMPSTGGPITTGGPINVGVPSSPNDADLGEQQILKSSAASQPFSALLTTPVFYTSNVALTNTGVVSDIVVAPLAGMFYDSNLTQNLTVHVGAQEQVFYYGTYTSFDFGSLDCQAGLAYLVPSLHNLMLRAWYDFNRLTNSDQLGNEFFSNHEIILDAYVPFQFGRAQHLSLGADANLSVGADHQYPRRNDYAAYATYSVNLARAFFIQANGQVVVRDYHQNGRTDVSEILSGSATYQLTNWASVSAISSFAHSDSNHSVFSYNVGNLGGTVELTVKF